MVVKILTVGAGQARPRILTLRRSMFETGGRSSLDTIAIKDLHPPCLPGTT